MIRYVFCGLLFSFSTLASQALPQNSPDLCPKLTLSEFEELYKTIIKKEPNLVADEWGYVGLFDKKIVVKISDPKFSGKAFSILSIQRDGEVKIFWNPEKEAKIKLGGYGSGVIDNRIRVDCDYYRIGQNYSSISPTISIGYPYEGK